MKEEEGTCAAYAWHSPDSEDIKRVILDFYSVLSQDSLLC